MSNSKVMATLGLMLALSACGADGKDGEDGATGELGVNGEPGASGADGMSGEDGTDGEDGEVDPAALEDAVEAAVEDAVGDAVDARLASACDQIDIEPPDDGTQLELALTLEPGGESEVCKLVMVEEGFNLNDYLGLYTAGSHHAQIYRTAYKDVIPTTDVNGEFTDGSITHPCTTASAKWDVNGVLAFGEPLDPNQEIPDGRTASGGGGVSGTLPDDVAFTVEAGDVLLINFHMLNTTDEPLEACYKVNLYGIPDEQKKHEAGTIFWYNFYATIPAAEPGTSTTSRARMACDVTEDVTLLWGVSHMHERGVGYKAELLSGDPAADDTTVLQVLHETNEWEDPEADIYDGGLALEQGQWIDYFCEYENHEDRNVAQGLATTDEMCMFIGYYYPRVDSMEDCASSMQNRNARVYGVGEGTGAEYLACFSETLGASVLGTGDDPDRYARLACVTETCESVSENIGPFMKCYFGNAGECQQECTALQSSYQATCSQNECAAEYGTDGSDGTCATQTAVIAAIPLCTSDTQLGALADECADTFCKTPCDDDPEGAACLQCIGAFTSDTPPPNNPTCVNSLAWRCIQAQAVPLAEECVTECFTGCITDKVTACTSNCVSAERCGAEVGALYQATCD